jgi:YD repeat-containing protein
MKRICTAIFTLLLLLFGSAIATAQSTNFDNLRPVSPTAWQFLKYSDLPVSKYTGIPDISIPLYTVTEDGISVPISLTYHAAGNRVNQEASWVGLGWDLGIGSVIQTINDKDDFSTDTPTPYTKTLPDWNGTPVPSEYPYRNNYPFGGNGPTWYTPYPSSIPNAPQPGYHSFKIATDYYVPINTNFDIRADQLFTSTTTDSEPDVFKANFLGHSINFIVDWKNGGFVVLNKQGYKVVRNDDDTWAIIVPSGDEFDFKQKNIVESQGTSYNINQSSPWGWEVTSKIWMLTKIITTNKRTITFNYTTTPTYQEFPSFSQKLQKTTLTSTSAYGNTGVPNYNYYKGYLGMSIYGDGVNYTYSNNREQYTYLSTIIFSNGQVNFLTSARSDVTGGRKLDSVSVVGNQLIKSFKFNYGYFDASGVVSNGYHLGDTTALYATKNLRLKLLSVKDNSGAVNTFTYNSQVLPKKNSYATDYWGYYNGQTHNGSMVPNPAQFNRADIANNGDNHSANLTYATAGVLTQIKYPTGGKVVFNYELNEFDNYYVPDFNSSSNTLSHGNGLRIQSVTYIQSDGTQSKKDVYTYSVGKAILPISYIRTYTICAANIYNAQTTLQQDFYRVDEVNGMGAFSPSSFGSVTGVGYDVVTNVNVNLAGQSNGKTVTYYNNHPDIATNSGISAFPLICVSLPAIKDVTFPDNGTVKAIAYYDNQNTLVKRLTNSYYTKKSATFYGARIFGAGNLFYEDPISTLWTIYKAQNLIGYYPIFDFETLQSGSKETSYFGTDSLSIVSTKTYDSYNQLATSIVTNSDGNWEETDYSYPYSYDGDPYSQPYTSRPVLTSMWFYNNRLSDIVRTSKTKVNPSTGPKMIYSFDRRYVVLGDKFVPGRDSIETRPGLNLPTVVSYDKYDSSNGNALQVTKVTQVSSVIWDYNNKSVVASVTNAPYSSVAYTSFEADGRGRWKFTGGGIPDNLAPTGKKVYTLNYGNIYRDSLDISKKYVVSYWSKSGPLQVNGTTAVTGYTYNGYTYYEHLVANPASGTITVSSTVGPETPAATIDELRLYPSDAQMETYTYEPLVGVTSHSDIGGKITYYEYDGAKRLLDIRDQKRNILKAYCYNFAGQSTGCGISVLYGNAARSQAFVKSCVAGYSGSTVTYQVPANTYTSTMSQVDADRQAQDDVTANGQAYANANGSCTPVPLFVKLLFVNSYTSGDTYNNYVANVYSDAACTMPANVLSDLNVNYVISTRTSDNGTITNQTFNMSVTVLAGTNSASVGPIDVNGCGGNNAAAATKMTSAQTSSMVSPQSVPGLSCSSTVRLATGAGYTPEY